MRLEARTKLESAAGQKLFAKKMQVLKDMIDKRAKLKIMRLKEEEDETKLSKKT